MMQPTELRGEPARATPDYVIRPEAAAAIRTFCKGAGIGMLAGLLSLAVVIATALFR